MMQIQILVDVAEPVDLLDVRVIVPGRVLGLHVSASGNSQELDISRVDTPQLAKPVDADRQYKHLPIEPPLVGEKVHNAKGHIMRERINILASLKNLGLTMADIRGKPWPVQSPQRRILAAYNRQKLNRQKEGVE